MEGSVPIELINGRLAAPELRHKDAAARGGLIAPFEGRQPLMSARAEIRERRKAEKAARSMLFKDRPPTTILKELRLRETGQFRLMRPGKIMPSLIMSVSLSTVSNFKET